MITESSIVGGYLKIQKSVFVQEMLSKDSYLRVLLNWKKTRDFAEQHPLVSEPGEDNVVTINFSSESSAYISEPLKEIMSDLKAKYREKIKGKVACRMEYSMFGGIFTFEIDLNSDDDKIEYTSS